MSSLPEELLRILPSHLDNSNIHQLTNLQINYATLVRIPSSISCLAALEELHLVGNQLTELPHEVGMLTRLQMLNLMENQLSHLPETIGNLVHLKNLGLKSNFLTALPACIARLTNLIGLFLTNNKLTTLPEEIGYLTNLRKLQCANNDLTRLPSSMSQLKSLELMRLAGNGINLDAHHSVFRMPRLRWLTLSANPISHHHPPQHPPRILSPKEFEDQISSREGDRKVLGEGASGEVSRVLWEGRDVALKLFKGSVSPDGACEDEVKVSVLLHHPNLIRVLALVEGSSQNTIRGMIMGLIPGKPLADRPNMNSYLRSRYASGLQYSVEKATRILSGVCSAAAYLHSIGVCHGDLYAHNVLVQEDGTSHLCDMGASFPYDRERFGSSTFELLEVSAFGLMISEVSKLLPPSAEKLKREWEALAERCMHEDCTRRPSFSQLRSELHTE